MPEISRETLACYLEDSLSTAETASVEQALRESDELRKQLRSVMQDLDRGEHSIGAIWRRERLSCPTREQLGSFLLQTLESEHQEYIQFHLDIIGCPFCHANFVDLQSKHQDKSDETQRRRKRFFQSSAGLIKVNKRKD